MKATWLFDEHPLVIDVKLAKVIGLNEAIVLQQLNYWLHSRSAKEIDGKKWIYNSMNAWQEQFPFWAVKTVKRIFSSLEESGLVIAGNYNKVKFDQTKWYTIDYPKLENRLGQIDPMERDKMSPSERDKMSQPILDTTETTTDTTNKGRKSRKAKQYDHDSPEYQTARYLYELIITNNEKFKKPHLQRWADTVRLMHERDGRSFEDIRAVANYAQHSSFWMSNVLSMNKLRKQFDRLYMQAKKAKPQPKEKDWSSWDNYGR